MIQEKHIERNLWLGLAVALLLSLFAMSTFGQSSLNPTFISVTSDSLRQRADTLWFSNKKGSVVYFRTKNDTLYFGDATGEKKVSQIGTGTGGLNFSDTLTLIATKYDLTQSGGGTTDSIYNALTGEWLSNGDSISNNINSITIGEDSDTTRFDKNGKYTTNTGNYYSHQSTEDTSIFYQQFNDINGNEALNISATKSFFNITTAVDTYIGNKILGFSYRKGLGIQNNNDTVFRVDTSGTIHFSDSSTIRQGFQSYPAASSGNYLPVYDSDEDTMGFALLEPSEYNPDSVAASDTAKMKIFSDTTESYYDFANLVSIDETTFDTLKAGKVVAEDTLEALGIVYTNPPHAALFRVTDLTITATQNIYYKVTGFTTKDADNMTVAGDSIQLPKGSFLINYTISMTGLNNEVWEIAVLKNGTPENPTQLRYTSTSDVGNAGCPVYIESDGNDWVSFNIRNTTDSDDPTIKRFSAIITTQHLTK